MRGSGSGEFQILDLCGYQDCIKGTQQVEYSFPSQHFSYLFLDNRHRIVQAMFGQLSYLLKWHLIGEKGHGVSKITVALKVHDELQTHKKLY